MYFPYFRPLVNYGRFLLEEERKRKIIEGQIPKIAAPNLFNQHNNISYIPKEMFTSGQMSIGLLNYPFLILNPTTVFHNSMHQ